MTAVTVRARRALFIPVIALLLSLNAAGASAAALPAKGTEILWDKWGIPHITAADHPSLFYAYGYAQMEAHSELLLRLYAQARGRGAEFYGEKYLEADRWVRVNGIPAAQGTGPGGRAPSSRLSSWRSSAA